MKKKEKIDQAMQTCKQLYKDLKTTRIVLPFIAIIPIWIGWFWITDAPEGRGLGIATIIATTAILLFLEIYYTKQMKEIESNNMTKSDELYGVIRPSEKYIAYTEELKRKREEQIQRELEETEAKRMKEEREKEERRQRELAEAEAKRMKEEREKEERRRRELAEAERKRIEEEKEAKKIAKMKEIEENPKERKRLEEMCSNIKGEIKELLTNYKDLNIEDHEQRMAWILSECYRKIQVIKGIKELGIEFDFEWYDEEEKIEKKAKTFINKYIKWHKDNGYEKEEIDVFQFEDKLYFISYYLYEKGNSLNRY